LTGRIAGPRVSSAQDTPASRRFQPAAGRRRGAPQHGRRRERPRGRQHTAPPQRVRASHGCEAVQHRARLRGPKISRRLSFPAASFVYSALEPMLWRNLMKNVLIAACVAAFAALATSAYAQNDAMSQGASSMSKDAMGHDAMKKDGMKKDAMKKHDAMKPDAMSHDAMGKASGDKMAPSN
jgi:pentapeptide MXKDX repeat protein